MNQKLYLAVAVAALLLTGCVTGRRIVTLEVPVATTNAAATKGNIAITQSTDARKFEDKPAAPSTPSVDGAVSGMSKDALKTMIGRQRNGFGKALGDIQLGNGDSVEAQARKLVAEGLKRRGYTTNDGGANNAQVKIEEFWAWFTPGFASISFESKLRCAITVNIKGVKKNLVVTGYGKDTGQMASNEHWQLAYKSAFEDFLKNLDTALAGAKL